MRKGMVMYTRPDGARMVFVGSRNGMDYARVIMGEQEFDPLPVISLTARIGWEPTPKMVEWLSAQPEEDL